MYGKCVRNVHICILILQLFSHLTIIHISRSLSHLSITHFMLTLTPHHHSHLTITHISCSLSHLTITLISPSLSHLTITHISCSLSHLTLTPHFQLLSSPSIHQAVQNERKEMKKIVLDFEQRQEEEEYEGRCTWQWVHLAVGGFT